MRTSAAALPWQIRMPDLRPLPLSRFRKSATRVAMIQSGDAQIMWTTPTESVSVLEADPNVNSYQDEGIVVRFLMMNTQKEPFNDVRVRQAMDYALNKEAYIQVVKNGLAVPATSVIGSAVQYYKGNEPRPYDLEKAKELFGGSRLS